MKTDNKSPRLYRYFYYAAVAGLFLPWGWAVFFMPHWMWLISAACSVSFAVVLTLLLRRFYSHETHDAPPVANVSGDISLSLNRWSGMAQETHDDLREVQTQLHGVMTQTERAVLNISGCFRDLSAKANAQTEYVRRLLPRGSAHPGEVDLLRESDLLVAQLTAEMGSLADRLTKSDNPADVRTAALAVKSVADEARANLRALIDDMEGRHREIVDIVARIENLGEEIRKDIYKIVIDLQFQDITHQKLQRVRAPVLDEVSNGLRSIAEETQLLYLKVRHKILGARPGEETPPLWRRRTRPVAVANTPPGEGGNVELF